MQNIWSVVDLLHQNPHWWTTIISSAYGVNLDSSMVDKHFVCSWQKWYATIITTHCFITLLIDRIIDSFHSSGNSSLFQTELVSLWMSQQTVLPPALISSAGIWSIPGDLLLSFSFSVAFLNSKALSSAKSGYDVYNSVCLTSLTPNTFNSWEKWSLQLAKILWKSATKSPFSSCTILVLGW